MNYRLIALDLDRTTLDSNHRISPQDGQALQQAAARGLHVVFASGRMSASIRQYPAALGLDGPVISYNGAIARDSLAHGDGLLLNVPLPAQYGDALIDFARRDRLQLNYYLDETLYAADLPELRPWSELYTARTGSAYRFVLDLAQFQGCSPTKALIVTDRSDATQPNPRHRDELYAAWQTKWGGQIDIVRTDPEYLEFMNPAANKGAALAAIAAHLGVPQAEVIAMGDGYNDTPMIEWAGLGVAVANANAEVKAAAQYICRATHNDSPVTEVLREFELLD